MKIKIIVKNKNSTSECTKHKHQYATHYDPSEDRYLCSSCAESLIMEGAIELTSHQWKIYSTVVQFQSQPKHIKKAAEYLNISRNKIKGILHTLRRKGVKTKDEFYCEIINNDGETVLVKKYYYLIFQELVSEESLLKDDYMEFVSKKLSIPINTVRRTIKILKDSNIKVPNSLERRQNRYNYIFKEIKIQIQKKEIGRYSLIRKVKNKIGCSIHTIRDMFRQIEEENNIQAWNGWDVGNEILHLLDANSEMSLRTVCSHLQYSSYVSVWQHCNKLHQKGKINKRKIGKTVYLSSKTS